MDRDLKLYPDEALTEDCQPVEDPVEWSRLVDTMEDCLYERNGIGLAAPQVGEPLRLFLLRLDPKKRLHEAYFNPEIISREDERTMIEGCLSYPNIRVEVDRATTVHFRALTPAGQSVERTVEGVQAQCVQHEVDHLEGMTLLERCDLSQKMEIQDKLKMLEDGKIPPPPEADESATVSHD